MTLGEFVKQYLSEHGMSQRAFSRLTGISNTYISYLISGKNSNGSKVSPTIDTYRTIAQSVGLSLDELIRSVDDDIVLNPSFTVEEQSFILLYRKASKRDRSIIREILQEYET